MTPAAVQDYKGRACISEDEMLQLQKKEFRYVNGMQWVQDAFGGVWRWSQRNGVWLRQAAKRWPR